LIKSIVTSLNLDEKTCNPPLNGQKPITSIGPHYIYKKKKRKKKKGRGYAWHDETTNQKLENL
jgi:hypothetical protein